MPEEVDLPETHAVQLEIPADCPFTLYVLGRPNVLDKAKLLEGPVESYEGQLVGFRATFYGPDVDRAVQEVKQLLDSLVKRAKGGHGRKAIKARQPRAHKRR